MQPVHNHAWVLAFVVSICLCSGFATAQTEVKIVGVPDVNVPEPIPHSELVVFRDVAVPPSRKGSRALTFAGNVFAEGYTSVMLSLAVEPSAPGTVTAYLIPAEKFVSDALDTKDCPILFPLAAEVSFSGDEDVTGSLSFQHQLAFPSYKAYLENHSDRPVKAQFFVYLRH